MTIKLQDMREYLNAVSRVDCYREDLDDARSELVEAQEKFDKAHARHSSALESIARLSEKFGGVDNGE